MKRPCSGGGSGGGVYTLDLRWGSGLTNSDDTPSVRDGLMPLTTFGFLVLDLPDTATREFCSGSPCRRRGAYCFDKGGAQTLWVSDEFTVWALGPLGRFRTQPPA